MERYQQLYPGIDCRTEINKVIGWCEANPKNRKTRSGAKRFLNGWLARAQDKASVKTEKLSTPRNRFCNMGQQHDYDYDAMVWDAARNMEEV